MTVDAPAREVTPTERVIAEMLLENTGAHMLDSGLYGRAWQMERAKYGLDGGLPNSKWHGGPSHQPKEPEEPTIEQIAAMKRDEPDAWFSDWGIYASTFHWLTRRLEYDERADRKFRRFAEVMDYGKDRYDKTKWHGVMEHFVEQLKKRGEVENLTGDNTYNHDNHFDRDVQYFEFRFEPKWDDDKPVLEAGVWVFVEIHGGADIRGGYTNPRLFRGGEYGLGDYGSIGVTCEGNIPEGQLTIGGREAYHDEIHHSWDTSYDGYSLKTENGDDIDLKEDEDRNTIWVCPIDGTPLTPWFYVSEE
jgi:hypothetical protein